MAKYIAVNQIEYLRDKKKAVVKPGAALPNHFDAKEIKRFLKLRAIREVEVDTSIPDENVDDDKVDGNEERAALEAKAKELGVKFRKNTSDEKLAEDVAAAAEEVAAAAQGSSNEDLL